MESRIFHKHWGAEYLSHNSVRFRLWATGQQSVTLRLGDKALPMEQAEDGWYQITVPDVPHGTEYQYELADGYDVVLIGRSFMKDAGYQEAERSIMQLFRRAGILKKKRS